MSQEPKINLDNAKRINEPSLPVPRRSKRYNEKLDPKNQEIFGSTGPDIGFALKIVNKYKTLWQQHQGKNL